MHSARPAQLVRPQTPIQRRQLVQVAVTIAAAAGAGGYLIADIENTDMRPWLPRTLVIVATVAFLQWVSEVRLARQVAREAASVRQDLALIIQRLEQRLATAEVAEAYVDGLQRRIPQEGRHLHSV